MPILAHMSWTPRKKRDFYNRSQGVRAQDGIGAVDSRHHEYRPPPQVMHSVRSYADSRLESPLEYGYYPSMSTLDYPTAAKMSHAHASDYAYANTSSGSPSPTGYGVDVLQNRHLPPPSGYCPQGSTREFRGAAPFAEPPVDPVMPWASGGSQPPEPPSQVPRNPVPPAGDADEKRMKAKKRKQKCRMCANHGLDVEVKGHKWFCPYRDREQHNCSKCEITRNKQLFVAKQQQITRQQQQQHVQNGEAEGSQPPPPPRPPNEPRDFPRMKELLDETAHVLDQEFLHKLIRITNT